MNNSLVLDFESKIADKNYSICDLLRHGLIIAKKLKQEESVNWIKSELDGYKENEELPDYRLIPMMVKFYNPVYGWCQFVITSEELIKKLEHMAIRQKISEIEVLSSEKEIMFDAPVAAKSMFLSQIPFESNIAYSANPIYLIGIIDSVKNRLLDWALLLEENEIIDEKYFFSKKQIQKADTLVPQTINIFYGDKNKIEVKQTMGENKTV